MDYNSAQCRRRQQGQLLLTRIDWMHIVWYGISLSSSPVNPGVGRCLLTAVELVAARADLCARVIFPC